MWCLLMSRYEFQRVHGAGWAMRSEKGNTEPKGTESPG